MTKKDNFYVYGKKPIEELSNSDSFSISKVFIKNSIAPNSYKNLTDSLQANSIPVSVVPEKKLQNLVGNVNHQGFVAQLSAVKYTDFFTWMEKVELSKNPAVLLLDGIEDPHNLGAILRTAAAADISAVILPTQNQAPVNATVFKTSAGTAGKIPIIRVHDTNQGVKDLKLAGFELMALAADAPQNIWEVTFEKPVAFIIGNEGRGVNKQIMRKADKLLSLPMSNEVESLNASVTAALISYEWQRKNYS